RRGTPPRSSRGKCFSCRLGEGAVGEAGRARAISRGPRPPPRWRPRRGGRRNRSTRSRRPWMRRTTICRSERAALLALVAGLLAGPAPVLVAQDTTQARPDTSQPAPDTSQAAPAPAPEGQLPSTHVVTRGETLWSIAQLYFSDPLLWPE